MSPKKGNRKPTVHADYMLSLRLDIDTFSKITALSIQQNCSKAEAVRRVFQTVPFPGVETKKPADGSP